MKLFETFIPQGLEDEVAELAFDKTDWSGGDGESYISRYARWADIEDNYDPSDPFSDSDISDKVDIDSAEFKSWFRNEIADLCGEAEWAIEEELRKGNGTMRVYRVITAPRDWKPDPTRHPGLWWAWDYKRAEAHWGSFNQDHIKWVLEADVHTNEINWPATLAANATMPDEAEIQLKEGAPVHIIEYYPYDELFPKKQKKA